MPSMGLYDRALTHVRSTGAGIKCLYCNVLVFLPDKPDNPLRHFKVETGRRLWSCVRDGLVSIEMGCLLIPVHITTP